MAETIQPSPLELNELGMKLQVIILEFKPRYKRSSLNLRKVGIAVALVEKDMTEGKLYIITQYLSWILVSSILFITMNLLFIFILLVGVTGIAEGIISVHVVILATVITSIPMGPAFSALLTVMKKILNHSIDSVIKDFFRGYRAEFKQSLIAWIILLSILLASLFNYYLSYSIASLHILIFPTLMIASLAMCMSFYVFPLIVSYHMKVKDLLKLALYFVFKEYKTTLILLVTFVISSYLFLRFPMFLIFIYPSGLALLLMFLTRKQFGKVHAKAKQDEENEEVGK